MPTAFYITANGQTPERIGEVVDALKAAGLVITDAYATIFANEPPAITIPPFTVEILADVEVKVFDAAGGGYQRQTRKKGDKMQVIAVDHTTGWWMVWGNPELWVAPQWKLYGLVK
jgi:hypothetical protein